MSAADGETSPNAGRGGAPTTDVIVAGAAGRMGNRIIACLADTPDLRLVAALEAPGHASLGGDAGELADIGKVGVAVGGDAKAVITRDRVLIEFSVPDASIEHLRRVAHAGAPGGVGTTRVPAAPGAPVTPAPPRGAAPTSPHQSAAP